jgi:hypothetical protein
LCIPQAAKDIRKSHKALIDIFGRIEGSFQRLDMYPQVPSTTEMLDTIVQIMAEVLTILGIATKEIKQGRISELSFMSVSPVTERSSEMYGKRLIGKTDMEDALEKLDRLTQEEARIIIAKNLWVTHAVTERAISVEGKVDEVFRGACRLSSDDPDMYLTLNCSDGRETKQVMKQRSSSPDLIDIGYGALSIISDKRLRDIIHKWLSPPDPSTNHYIACGTHHKKTAAWFFEGNIYKEWKSKSSLLWIHGKRAPCLDFLSDTP